MSEENSPPPISPVPSSRRGRKRRRNDDDDDDYIENMIPTTCKKQKRMKLSKSDNNVIKANLDNNNYKIVPYSMDNGTTNYKYVSCVIDARNKDMKYARMVDEKSNKNYEKNSHIDIVLSVGDTLYVFICNQCLAAEIIQIWKHGTSSRNFAVHQTKIHGLISNKIEWKMEHRMQMLKPTIQFCAWDRQSFNGIKGAGLDKILTAAYNLGCQMGKPVITLDGLLFCPTVISTRVKENGKEIEFERKLFYVDYFYDKGNYPYSKSIETDMWKSVSCADFINLIIRDPIPNVGIICNWEDLCEFSNLCGLAVKHNEIQFMEKYHLNQDQMEQCKQKLDELKSIRDEEKKKSDYKNKVKKRKQALKKRNKRKKCIAEAMLFTYVNKIEMKHWIALFLCGTLRDFDEFGFLDGVKPKLKPLIKTSSFHDEVIKTIKLDITNIQIFDKYCEWRGLYNRYNQKKMNINAIQNDLNTLNINIPKKSRKKSTIDNLLKLRRKSDINNNSNDIQSLSNNQNINNDEQKQRELPSSDLELSDVITQSFVTAAEIHSKNEVDYYLSVDFINITDDRKEQIMNNPMIPFREEPLRSKAPILSERLAPHYLYDLESESGSERQFSDAGNTATDIRSLLAPETIAALQRERMRYLREKRMNDHESH